MSSLQVYNTLSRRKEKFIPLIEGRVGMYVCGPTVYSDVHLGNCRSFVSFDVIYRYLMHLGYRVRYVRNITDVGHLEGDADTDAEDKISKRARLEQIEPMEIVQRYTNGFHKVMDTLNALSPSIEPRATGHIVEQIQMVDTLLKNGYAYEVNGSVYFDTKKLTEETNSYGQLSGRKVEDLLTETRDELKNQSEKRYPGDFAVWIKASPEHLMRWPSPWSVGFPGWHLECSVMSTKYLGKKFDIHGGGTDLKFPHHENEIAQNYGACECSPANYWLHGNMLLMNGRKMSKSDGNTVTAEQLFTGNSPHLSKAYHPMVVRFFMLQSHYRSTLDLTDAALSAAETGYRRLMKAWQTLIDNNHPGNGAHGVIDKELLAGIQRVTDEMNDDFNTPRALARLFDLAGKINTLVYGDGNWEELTEKTWESLRSTFRVFLFDVFGLQEEQTSSQNDQKYIDSLMNIILELRSDIRARKDWAASDQLRDNLKEIGIQVKDGKEGASWELSN